MFNWLYQRLWSRPALIPIQIAERYGERPDLTELKAALEQTATNPQVRAVVHLLLLARTQASMSARGAARMDKPSAFDLGGVDYLDSLFTELDGLVRGEPVSGAVEAWFAPKQK